MPNKHLVFSSDKIGEGELGAKVAVGFLKSLTQVSADLLPKQVIFLNRGVLLSTQNTFIENAQALQILRDLEKLGVEILSCQACVEHFEAKVAVGRLTNAPEVLEILLSSHNAISF
ncbi:hypothetical protein ACFOPX_02010 [Helicobacter baculiformis]|uniref:Sulfurtransferase-like selenium metabolism protein YedF n=1 Tax=Helicobacter baculiformis TaxID=427351 RepID=A0ABV7ZH11_9HELI|nr:hypothetical protein [Helicobacter baculiformis]